MGSSEQGMPPNAKVSVVQDLERPSLKELLADERRQMLEVEIQSQPQGLPIKVTLALDSLPTVSLNL